MPTILITGVNRGIGRALATAYLADGWTVYGTVRKPESDIPEGCRKLLIDIADPTSIADMKSAIDDQPIDILWNNAGVYLDKGQSLAKMSNQDWETSFQINCIAPIRLAEAIRPNIAASTRKGIVFTSSRMASLEGHGEGSYAYRSSKTALNMAVRCLTHEVESDGISCIMMHPGWVVTDMGGSSADIDVATSAAGMKTVADKLCPEAQSQLSGGYFNYDGSTIPW